MSQPHELRSQPKSTIYWAFDEFKILGVLNADTALRAWRVFFEWTNLEISEDEIFVSVANVILLRSKKFV